MSEVIVFDLDDTLYPEADFVLSGFRAVSQWFEKEKGVAKFFSVAKSLFEDGSRGNIFNLALERLNLRYDDKLINEAVAVYRNHDPAIALFTDANWAIDFYSNKNLAIITDGYFRTQVKKVKALGVEEKFNKIIYTDQFGREFWKPSPMSFLKIMDFFKCSGQQCYYVGDNPTKDFVTPNTLGWRTVQVRRVRGEYKDVEVEKEFKAQFNIDDLYGLKFLI